MRHTTYKIELNKKKKTKCPLCGEDIFITLGTPCRKSIKINLDGTMHTCGHNLKVYSKEEIEEYIRNSKK
jgi:hypothetical protein